MDVRLTGLKFRQTVGSCTSAITEVSFRRVIMFKPYNYAKRLGQVFATDGLAVYGRRGSNFGLVGGSAETNGGM